MRNKSIVCLVVFLIIFAMSVNVFAIEVFEYNVNDEEFYNDYAFSQGLLLFRQKDIGRYGYKNTHGEVVISPIFYDAKIFSEGLAAVTDEPSPHYIESVYMDKSRFYGYINLKGIYVLPPQYYTAESFKNGKAIVSNKDGFFIIDKSGKKLTDYFSYISREDNGYIVSQAMGDIDPIYLNGFINEFLEFVLPIKYTNIQYFSDNYFVVTDDQGTYALEVDSGKRIYINKEEYNESCIYQIYDGKAAYYEYEHGKSTGMNTIISDFNGNIIWKSIESHTGAINILPNGYLAKSGMSHLDDDGNVVLTIIIKPNGETFSADLWLKCFDKYLVGHAEMMIRAFYDYEGNIIIGKEENDYYIIANNRVYGIKDEITSVYDLNFNLIGTSNLAVSKSNTFWESILYGSNDNQKKISFIFEKNGMKGICDADLNILVDAKYKFLWERGKESNDGTERFEILTEDNINTATGFIYVYNENSIPKVIEEYYPITEQIDIKPFSLMVGSPIVETNDGTVFIDPNNHNVVSISENDRVLVPMRFITERINGALVYWDGDKCKATFSIPGRKVTVWEGSYSVVVESFNEQTRRFEEINYNLDIPVRIINSRTFVPLRSVSEFLNLYVAYDDNTGIITIKNSAGE